MALPGASRFSRPPMRLRVKPWRFLVAWSSSDVAGELLALWFVLPRHEGRHCRLLTRSRLASRDGPGGMRLPASLPSLGMASRSPNIEKSLVNSHELRRRLAGAGSWVRFGVAPQHFRCACTVLPRLDRAGPGAARRQVYAHKAAVLRAGKAVSGRDVDAAGDAPFPEALERHDAVVADLAGVLAGLDPGGAAWTWMEGAGESTVGAWARRMAHEALVHRVDAELTAGMAISPVDVALPIDGVNEVLTWMAGDPDVVAEEQSSAGTSGTVLFDYGEAAWLVELGDGKHLVTPAHAGPEQTCGSTPIRWRWTCCCGVGHHQRRGPPRLTLTDCDRASSNPLSRAGVGRGV